MSATSCADNPNWSALSISERPSPLRPAIFAFGTVCVIPPADWMIVGSPPDNSTPWIVSPSFV